MNKIHLLVQSLLFTVFLSSCSAVLRFTACKTEQQIGQKVVINGAKEAAQAGGEALTKPKVAQSTLARITEKEAKYLGEKNPLPISRITSTAKGIHVPLIPDEATAIEKEALERCIKGNETIDDIALIQKSRSPVARTYNLIITSRKEEQLVSGKTSVVLRNTNGKGTPEKKLLQDIINKPKHDALNKGVKRFNDKVEIYKGSHESGIAENTERQFNDLLKEALTDIEFIKTYSLNPVTGIVTMTIAVSESQEAKFEVKVQI